MGCVSTSIMSLPRILAALVHSNGSQSNGKKMNNQIFALNSWRNKLWGKQAYFKITWSLYNKISNYRLIINKFLENAFTIHYIVTLLCQTTSAIYYFPKAMWLIMHGWFAALKHLVPIIAHPKTTKVFRTFIPEYKT